MYLQILQRRRPTWVDSERVHCVKKAMKRSSVSLNASIGTLLELDQRLIGPIFHMAESTTCGFQKRASIHYGYICLLYSAQRFIPRFYYATACSLNRCVCCETRGPLSLWQNVRCLRQCCRAGQYTHQTGPIHHGHSVCYPQTKSPCCLTTCLDVICIKLAKRAHLPVSAPIFPGQLYRV